MASSSESHGTHDLNFPVEPVTNDKALEAALLPCPFCGSPAYDDEATARIFGERAGHKFAIACTGWEHSSHGCDSMEEAIAAWNRRVPVSALPGEAEVVALRDDSEKISWLTSERERLIKAAIDVATQRNNLILSYQAMQARAEAAERERDDIVQKYADVLDDFRRKTHRAEAAEARVKELEEALAYAVKGLDMIHNGLMDPTRPRQSVGEVCAHFLSTARAGGSNG